ncbi:MAG: ribonuclease HII [Lachnospiraceae bacterium]|nr:ribonuclease HII [Lachnospiraceae bacterium]
MNLEVESWAALHWKVRRRKHMSRQRIDPQEKYRLMSEYEEKARAKGISRIAGIDEAGRGPLAGPVVAAAVMLDPDRPIYGVDDSKKLSAKRRAELKIEIEEKAVAIGVGIVDVETIDRINILEATKLAMQKAVQALTVKPELLLIDAVKLKEVSILQEAIIKGDALSVSIAAASIIAKETRDEMLRAYDVLYPEYGFASHKGYGTQQHRDAIRQLGPLPIHRRSFLKNILQNENSQ